MFNATIAVETAKGIPHAIMSTESVWKAVVKGGQEKDARKVTIFR